MTETIQTAMDRLMTISAEPQDYVAEDGLMGCCTAAAAKLPRKRSFRMAKNCLGVTAIRLNAGAGRLQGKSKRKKNVQGCITRKCSG